jgi:hypothetical protein
MLRLCLASVEIFPVEIVPLEIVPVEIVAVEIVPVEIVPVQVVLVGQPGDERPQRLPLLTLLLARDS